MQRKLKSLLSKVNFFLGRTPKIEKVIDYRRFIPEPYKAVVTITADFELAWAWRYSKSVPNPLERAKKFARQERENVPQILKICEEFNIPITWATVGHLFLQGCERGSGVPHPELPRLGNFENDYWKFSGRDWFEHDPYTDYKSAPEWYCPDLIDQILNSKVKHEIGCHTFSHIDCSDAVCSKEVFDAEVELCQKLALERGVELKSFVHPGHTIGNIGNLADHGFASFQSDPGNILGYPVKHLNGLWELKRTYEFVFRIEWSVDYHIYRYKEIIERAIKNNSVCNFWFHPSCDVILLNQVIPEIFKHLHNLKDQIVIATCESYSDFLNRKVF